jgi:hypothetical protein
MESGFGSASLNELGDGPWLWYDHGDDETQTARWQIAIHLYSGRMTPPEIGAPRSL